MRINRCGYAGRLQESAHRGFAIASEFQNSLALAKNGTLARSCNNSGNDLSRVARNNYPPSVAVLSNPQSHGSLAATLGGLNNREGPLQCLEGPPLASNTPGRELSSLPSALQGLCVSSGEGPSLRGNRFSLAFKRHKNTIG